MCAVALDAALELASMGSHLTSVKVMVHCMVLQVWFPWYMIA